MIPIDHMIPDVLHLFLRICDVLINLLILDLRRLDGIEKVQTNFDRSKAAHVAKYEKFLNEQCKISFHMYVDKVSKSLKWRDLLGPEKLRLLKEIDIPKLFPALTNATTLQGSSKQFTPFFDQLHL